MPIQFKKPASSKTPSKTNSKPAAKAAPLRRGYFDDIKNAKSNTKLPRLKEQGVYLIHVNDAKCFTSNKDGRSQNFVIEFTVLSAENDAHEGKDYCILRQDGKFPLEWFGFIKGFVAAARNIPEEEVSPEMTTEAISLEDEGTEGDAKGARVLMRLTDKYKDGELSDFPDCSFEPYVEDSAEEE